MQGLVVVEALRVVVALAFWQRECGARLGAALACETRYGQLRHVRSVTSQNVLAPLPAADTDISQENTKEYD